LYENNNLRKIFYEFNDFFETLELNWQGQIFQCIKNKILLQAKKKVYQIYNLFINVTKNHSLFLEVTKKLIICDLFYQERLFSNLIKDFIEKFKENKEFNSQLKKLMRDNENIRLEIAIKLVIQIECKTN
jgi:hypothetical protein